MQLYNKRIYGRTKEINIEELRSKFHSDKLAYIKLAVLFGSRASGRGHFQSDYDFALLSDDNEQAEWGMDAKYWNDIGDVLKLSDCDYDIVNLKKVDSNLLSSIKEHYVILKGDENELQRVFERNKKNC